MEKKLATIFFIIMILLSTSCTKTTEPSEYNNDSLSPLTPKEPTVNNLVNKSYEDTIIENMNINEKIGQLVIVGLPQHTLEEEIIDFLNIYKVGGFILFKRNYNSFKELYELNLKLKNLNKNNPLPLFISVDEEGSTVSRLPKEGTKVPDAVVFGNINDENLTEKSGIIIGRQLYAAGINLNFAPVLDILSTKDNKLLKLRSYGKDIDIVSKHGIAFINGLASQGIISVAKHFPGHGYTNKDSHGTLPVINIDYTTLKNRELVPFQNAINAGIDAVMIGHLAFPKIDSSGKPATKSKVFVTDILRNELGFQGITLTDDIEMKGFIDDKQSLEESVIESFNAGIDVFIIGHTKEIQKKVLKTLLDGVSEGLITEERLNESLRRIIKIKHKYKLSNNMNMDFDEAYNLFTDEKNHEFQEEVKRKNKQ